MAENETNYKTTFTLAMEDESGSVPGDFSAALQSIGKVATSVNGILSALSGPAGTIAAGVGSYELISKALDVAKKADESAARLRQASGGNSALLKQIQEITKALSGESVFGKTSLLESAADLLTRGVPQSQLPAALKAATDLASGLRISLEDASREIATTFGGSVPRDLARAIPSLKNMTEESLRLGGALQKIEDRLGGQAAAVAKTPFGQAERETNAITDQYKEIGDQLIKLEDEILPVAVQLLTSLNAELQSPAGQKFLEFLGHVLTQSLRIAPALAAIAVAGRGLNPLMGLFEGLAAKADVMATASERAAAATARAAAASRAAVGGVGAIVGGYLGYSAGGTSGLVSGALIGGAVAGSGPLGTAAVLTAAGDAVYIFASKLLGINQDFDSLDKQTKLLQDTFNRMAEGHESSSDILNAGVGDAIHTLHNHGVDATGEGAMEARLFNFFGIDEAKLLHRVGLTIAKPVGNAEPVTSDDKTANDRIAADNAAGASSGQDRIVNRHQELLARLAELDEQFAQEEADAKSQSDDQDTKAAVAANQRKLALQLEGLKQFLDEEYRLTDEATDKRLVELEKQIADSQSKGQKDRDTGRLVEANAEAERRNALEREYVALKAQATDQTEQQREAALALAQRQAEFAARDLGRSSGHTRDLVSQGQISPEQGRADALAALSLYRSRLDDIRIVLQGMATEEGAVGDEAKQMLALLDQEAADTAAKIQKLVSDIRSIGEAGHDAALSLQQTTQKGVQDFLDAIITKSEKASDALRKLGRSIAENLLNSATGRISELVTGAASNGVAGGGIFGLLGNLAVGNFKALAPTDSNTPTPAPTTQPSSSGGSDGGILGAIFKGLGVAIGGLFGGGDASSSNSSGGSGGGSYASGGYTGNAGGIVHPHEFVVNAQQVRAAGGPNVLSRYLAMTSSRSSVPSMMSYLSSSSSPGGSVGIGGGNINAAADRIHAAASVFANAQAQPRVHVAVPVTGELASQIFNHPDSPATMAAMMAANQQTFGPIIASMNAANA